MGEIAARYGVVLFPTRASKQARPLGEMLFRGFRVLQSVNVTKLLVRLRL